MPKGTLMGIDPASEHFFRDVAVGHVLDPVQVVDPAIGQQVLQLHVDVDILLINLDC